MSRLTNAVAGGETARIEQYNNLRKEATASSYFQPYENTPADLKINIAGGVIQNYLEAYDFEGGETPLFDVPTTNDRIDLVYLYAGEKSVLGKITQDVADSDALRIGGSGGGSSNRIGQSFILDNDLIPDDENDYYTLETISFIGRRAGSFNNSATNMSIFEADSNHEPVGTALFSTNFNTNNLVSGAFDSYFSFQNIFIQLQKNQRYVITCSNTNSSSNNDIFIKKSDTNTYADGRYLESTNSGSTWTSSTTEDLAFSLSVSGTNGIVQKIGVNKGIESVEPKKPEMMPALNICYIYNRAGQTSIKEEDDGVNGYILQDVRNSQAPLSINNGMSPAIYGPQRTKGYSFVNSTGGIVLINESRLKGSNLIGTGIYSDEDFVIGVSNDTGNVERYDIKKNEFTEISVDASQPLDLGSTRLSSPNGVDYYFHSDGGNDANDRNKIRHYQLVDDELEYIDTFDLESNISFVLPSQGSIILSLDNGFACFVSGQGGSFSANGVALWDIEGNLKGYCPMTFALQGVVLVQNIFYTIDNADEVAFHQSQLLNKFIMRHLIE